MDTGNGNASGLINVPIHRNLPVSCASPPLLNIFWNKSARYPKECKKICLSPSSKQRTLEKSHDFVKAETPSTEDVKNLHETMSSIATAIATGA